MRISLPITIACGIAVVAITWWIGTRGTDFMTPPSEQTLKAIENEVEQSMPAADHPRDAVSAPNRTRQVSHDYIPKHKFPRPVIKADGLSQPPELDEYLNEAKKGAAYLIDLAQLSENHGQNQRALLAWERVLDATDPSPEEVRHTVAAIHRLKRNVPNWNSDPDQQIHITLQAGTTAAAADQVEPVLRQVAATIESASSGILRVSLEVISGDGTLNPNGPAPVALWLRGHRDGAGSTEILSFSITDPESIAQDAYISIYRLVRGYLIRETTFTPPLAIQQTTPVRALNSQITRRAWKTLGESLNQPSQP